jgi:hypothetical protein
MAVRNSSTVRVTSNVVHDVQGMGANVFNGEGWTASQA